MAAISPAAPQAAAPRDDLEISHLIADFLCDPADIASLRRVSKLSHHILNGIGIVKEREMGEDADAVRQGFHPVIVKALRAAGRPIIRLELHTLPKRAHLDARRNSSVPASISTMRSVVTFTMPFMRERRSYQSTGCVFRVQGVSDYLLTPYSQNFRRRLNECEASIVVCSTTDPRFPGVEGAITVRDRNDTIVTVASFGGIYEGVKRLPLQEFSSPFLQTGASDIARGIIDLCAGRNPFFRLISPLQLPPRYILERRASLDDLTERPSRGTTRRASLG